MNLLSLFFFFFSAFNVSHVSGSNFFNSGQMSPFSFKPINKGLFTKKVGCSYTNPKQFLLVFPLIYQEIFAKIVLGWVGKIRFRQLSSDFSWTT